MTEQDLPKAIYAALDAFAGTHAENELAYLALTSKPEFIVRDHVAWHLHRNLPSFLGIAREWRPPGKSKKGSPSWRSDLAILDIEQDPVTPALLLEVKSCYSFDAVKGDAARKRFPIAAVSGDVSKSYEYANPDTVVMALLVVVHPRAPVPQSLFQVVKFAATINTKLLTHGDETLAKATKDFFDAHLPAIAPVYRSGLLATGSAFDIPTDVSYWLLGPATRIGEEWS